MAKQIKVTVAKLGADDIIVEVPEGSEVCKIAGQSGLDTRGCVYQVNGKTVTAQETIEANSVLTLVPRVEGGR